MDIQSWYCCQAKFGWVIGQAVSFNNKQSATALLKNGKSIPIYGNYHLSSATYFNTLSEVKSFLSASKKQLGSGTGNFYYCWKISNI